MKPTPFCYLSLSDSKRITISEVFLLTVALFVFLMAAFQADSVQAQQFPSVSTPRIATPATTQVLKVPPGAKNALVIVVEENTAQSFSVTWSGMSNAMRTMVIKNLLPHEIRSKIETINNTVRTVLPQIDIMAVAEEQVRRHVAAMMKQSVRNLRSQFGLPGSGCISGILDTMILQAPAVGNDMYKVFRDRYGESGLMNCLKETALPYYYRVEVLTDREASFQRFKDVLLKLHREVYTIDILLDIHGCGAERTTKNTDDCGAIGLCFYDPYHPTKSDRRNADALKKILDGNNGQKLRINAVYMVPCWGSEFNSAWREIGAKASNGPLQVNYYVLLSPLVFLDAFTRREMTLKAAADQAYNVEKVLLNGISFTVKIDLRPDLNRLLPIRYVAPKPCGVTLPVAGWVGLSTKIDYRGNKDYCIGQVGPQKFEFQKSCPVGYTMVVQGGGDRCKQDLLGPLRDQAHWQFDLGPSYGPAVDTALGTIYGKDKKPVDNKASSKRVQNTSTWRVRQALVCRGDDKWYCFGSAGQMCGGMPLPGVPQGEYWGCTGTQCVINAGSMEHDKCCYDNPKVGNMCGPGTATSQVCLKELTKAAHRIVHRLFWKRWVDTCYANTTGIVDHAQYCAPSGTIVAREDAFACCNEKVRAYNPANVQDQRRAKTQGVKMDGTFVPAVCE
jgi:UDP-N-acetylenolpyruvoylglucosamine reductase